jgi:hypothetical protein
MEMPATEVLEKYEKQMTVTEFVIICSVLNIATDAVQSAQNCFYVQGEARK